MCFVGNVGRCLHLSFNRRFFGSSVYIAVCCRADVTQSYWAATRWSTSLTLLATQWLITSVRQVLWWWWWWWYNACNACSLVWLLTVASSCRLNSAVSAGVIDGLAFVSRHLGSSTLHQIEPIGLDGWLVMRFFSAQDFSGPRKVLNLVYDDELVVWGQCPSNLVL